QSCGIGVFEDREGGDIVNVHAGEIPGRHFDSVDQNQWIFFTRRTKGRDPTDKKLGVVQSRFSGSLKRDDAGQFSGKSGGNIARGNSQIRGVDRGNRAQNAFFLLGGSVGRNDNSFQQLGIGFQDNSYSRLAIDGYFLCGVTQVRKNQY